MSLPDFKLERLITIKSAYILEARASQARGLETAAMALFLKAGEIEIAELFRLKDDAKNARVSTLRERRRLLIAAIRVFREREPELYRP